MHVSTHIEKTAGTSVQRVLEKLYGEQNVFIYDVASGSFTRSDQGKPTTNLLWDAVRYQFLKTHLLNAIYKMVANYEAQRLPRYEITELPESARALHGHFNSDFFDDTHTPTIHTVVMREPLERMVSHFRHWQRRKGTTNMRTNIPYDGNLSFYEFAMLPELRNFQTNSLSGKDLKSFDLVGVTELLDEHAQGLVSIAQELDGVERNPENFKPKTLNRTPNTHSVLDIDGNFLQCFRVFHRLDYENYSLAQELATR